jgi:hypothetical protein
MFSENYAVYEICGTIWYRQTGHRWHCMLDNQSKNAYYEENKIKLDKNKQKYWVFFHNYFLIKPTHR